MPFVAPGEGLDLPFADLDAIARAHGDGPWRVALLGTPRLRTVLVHWGPGHATVPHVHPRADEIFVILSGRAVFAIGDEPEREVGPGEFMYAAPGVRHAIRVPEGGGPVTLIAAVAPNEDVEVETIEEPVAAT
jgi:mannose-6-phosphate isomerase-like protein (cupin superfamily)